VRTGLSPGARSCAGTVPTGSLIQRSNAAANSTGDSCPELGIAATNDRAASKARYPTCSTVSAATISLFMAPPSTEHSYRAGIVREDLLRRVVDELRRRAPDLEISTPSEEPDVRRLGQLGVVWVEQYKDGSFALAIQDDRGTNDWGAALDKRVLLDPSVDETIEAAAIEALALLKPLGR
jgi:hypothetical protein